MNSNDELGPLYQSLDQIKFILENYVNRTISGVGIVLNSFFLFVLINKALNKKKVYNCLWTCTFCNLIVCVYGVAYLQQPEQLYPVPLYELIYRMCTSITIRVAFLASLLSKILLVLERYYRLFGIKNLCSRGLPKKFILFVCYSIGICFVFPVFFSFEVRESNATGLFYFKTSKFGSTLYFRVYSLLVYLAEVVGPVLALLIVNLKSLNKFRQVINASSPDQQSVTTRARNRFTRYVLVLGILGLVAHTGDMLSGISIRLRYTNLLEFTTQQILVSKLSKQTAMTLMFTLHSFDALIYLKMDCELKRLVKKMFLVN